MKRVLVVMGMLLTACSAASDCHDGEVSRHGTCYYRAHDWAPLAERERLEALFTARVPAAAEVWAQLHVEAMPGAFYCGTVPAAGCTLGPGLVQVQALPLCASELVHEVAHIVSAREHGDYDYGHTGEIWAEVMETRKECER